MPSRFSGKTVLITGASSGIGAALAREYAAQGANLVLIARRLDRLELLASDLKRHRVQVLPYAADVCRPQDLERIVGMALQELGKIDIVFANAGFGVAGTAESLTLEDYRRQFETNVFGVLHTFFAVLAALKQSQGHFVVIGSVFGYLAMPGNAAYCMSKFAIRALAETLWIELRRHGIRVTHISPGAIATEFRQVDNQGQFLVDAVDPLPAWLQMPADKAARQIIGAVARGRREKTVTSIGWIVVRLVRHFPTSTAYLLRILGLTGRPQPS